MITTSNIFRSVAETVVPEARHLSDQGWRDFAAIIEHAVAQRPRAVQRQLALFLFVLNVLALAKYGRTVSQLIPSMRTEFCENVQNSRSLLFRRGFWGVRTLVLMGYYARPEAQALIGYRAHIDGWSAR